MKFSILLPTRNRLDLLRYAVESVRLQADADWEIVISDNASTEDVAGLAASYADNRIRYFRTQQLLPVTDNWNAALDRSTGDYVIMLGDDDALMRNSLSTIRELLQKWNDPDAVYAQAIQFAYPGVIPGHPQGFTQVAHNAFLKGVDQPYLLPRETKLDMVRGAMDFRILFGFNMQYFVVSRRLVEALRCKGPFFQSPYPDYYAANAVLLAAGTVIACPKPLVMIGISPKSFGYYYFNRRENEGVDFLQNVVNDGGRSSSASRRVPGTNMNDSWLAAMEILRQNFASELELRVGYRRYRLLQYYALWRMSSWRSLPTLARHMRLWEMAIYAPFILVYIIAYALPGKIRRAVHKAVHDLFSATPSFDPKVTSVSHGNILEAVRDYGR